MYCHFFLASIKMVRNCWQYFDAVDIVIVTLITMSIAGLVTLTDCDTESGLRLAVTLTVSVALTLTLTLTLTCVVKFRRIQRRKG